MAARYALTLPLEGWSALYRARRLVAGGCTACRVYAWVGTIAFYRQVGQMWQQLAHCTVVGSFSGKHVPIAQRLATASFQRFEA